MNRKALLTASLAAMCSFTLSAQAATPELKNVNLQVYTLVLNQAMPVKNCVAQFADFYRSLGWSVDTTTVAATAGLVVANEKKTLVITAFCQPNNKTVYVTVTDPFKNSDRPAQAIKKITQALQ